MSFKRPQLKSPRKPLPRAVFRSRRVPILLRWAFLLFVFTIPMEALNLTLNLGPISIARFAGLLLFGLSVIYHNRCYSLVPKPMLWFAAYLTVFVMGGSLLPNGYTRSFITELMTMVQLVAFFWIASNVMRHINFSRRALLVYGVSVGLLSVGVLFSLPGFAQRTITDKTGDRISAIGYDPNYFGMLLGIAAIILIGLILSKEIKVRSLKFLLFPLLLVVFAFLVQTGSRSAMAACAMTMLFFTRAITLPRRHMVTAVLVICAVLVGGYLLLHNRDTMARWAETVYEGDTAGRDRIFWAAVDMIWERPFLGWGPVEWRFELNRRYDGSEAPRDAHNFILNLMLEVGLFGTMLFMFGILSCFRAALKSRKSRLGNIPLALLTFVCVFLQFQPWMTSKPFWFVLSLTVATASGMQRYPVRPRVRARLSARAFPPPSPSVAYAFHLAGNGQSQQEPQGRNLQRTNS